MLPQNPALLWYSNTITVLLLFISISAFWTALWVPQSKNCTFFLCITRAQYRESRPANSNVCWMNEKPKRPNIKVFFPTTKWPSFLSMQVDFLPSLQICQNVLLLPWSPFLIISNCTGYLPVWYIQHFSALIVLYFNYLYVCCCGLNVCVSPKFIRWNSNALWDGIRTWESLGGA